MFEIRVTIKDKFFYATITYNDIDNAVCEGVSRNPQEAIRNCLFHFKQLLDKQVYSVLNGLSSQLECIKD